MGGLLNGFQTYWGKIPGIKGAQLNTEFVVTVVLTVGWVATRGSLVSVEIYREVSVLNLVSNQTFANGN